MRSSIPKISLFSLVLWIALSAGDCGDKPIEFEEVVRISLHDDCSNSEVNYSSNHPYAYFEKVEGAGLGLIAGGHDGTKDISVTITKKVEQDSTYTLNEGSQYDAWVTYYPTEKAPDLYYYSIGQGTVHIRDLVMSDSAIERYDIRFNNVKVVNDSDTLCINGKVERDFKDQ